MRSRQLSAIAQVVGGRLVGDDVTVSSVTPDGRSAGFGALFLALPGERTDGHNFVAQARAAGASGSLVTRNVDGPHIIVDNVLAAVQGLAADERRASGVIVVGVTGSTGKTLTKDMIAAALRPGRVVHAASGSFNNELGLPLTLLGAAEDTEVIIAEMGARGVGHIADLCRIAAPDIGVVTNVGVAHMELFGSPEQIILAKGELVESLPSTGLAVLNDDDQAVRCFDARTSARVARYGLGAAAQVRASDIVLDDDARASFDVVTEEGVTRVHLAIPGEHMVHNALAAMAVALELGVDPVAAAAGIAAAETSPWRMEMHDTSDGIRIINDAYNANPTSMAAALRTARRVARDRRLIAVLGAMRELGDRSFEEHERVGELAARIRVDKLFTVGDEALPIARAAVREGVEPDNVRSFDDAAAAAKHLRENTEPGDVVLLKASRAVGLERLAHVLDRGDAA